jgi:hypothetical protein
MNLKLPQALRLQRNLSGKTTQKKMQLSRKKEVIGHHH